MSNYTEQIQPIVGRRVVRAEWVGNLSIDDNEGYLLTFDDGSQILFSWYQAYDCVGVLHELRPAQQSVQPTVATEPLEDSPWQTGARRCAVIPSTRNSR